MIQQGSLVRIIKDGTGEHSNWLGRVVKVLEDEYNPKYDEYAVAFREPGNASIPITGGFLGYLEGGEHTLH